MGEGAKSRGGGGEDGWRQPKNRQGRGNTYIVFPGSRPDPLGDVIHIHPRVRNSGRWMWERLGPRLPRGRECEGVARHEWDEEGRPFVRREENGIERYRFVHRGGISKRSCTGARRVHERVGKVDERG